MKQRQRTISRSATLSGLGLFSGEAATLTLRPAEADSGVRFMRLVDDRAAVIVAHVANVTQRPRRTCLHNGSLMVETVEHCLAALAGMEIDNATVEVAGKLGELPGGDGSSKPFVDLVLQAGIEELPAERKPLVIQRPVQVSSGDATIAALPGDPDKLEILYDFEAPGIARQLFVYQVGSGDFATEVAPARTFLFENEALEAQSRGIGKHLTTHDLLVIGENGPIDNAYRFADECARHKVLDILGDLSLVGRPLRGRIVAHKSGHKLNHALARRLLEQQRTVQHADLLKREAALDIRRIQRILPHRYPMLLVDRVLELEGDQRAVGIKNVTFNDVFFQGHYPGAPIMPGVLIVEAMAQLGGILLSQKLEHTGKLAVLLSMDKVKMRNPVVPGDQLVLEAVTVRVKSRTGHVRCKAFVQDKLAAEADIKFMLVDAEPL